MRALRWIGRNVSVILGGIAAVLVGFLAWGAYQRRVGGLKDSIKIEKAKGKIAALHAERVAVLTQADAKAEEVAEIDQALVENKKAIVAIHQEVKDLKDDEIADEFAKLGY